MADAWTRVLSHTCSLSQWPSSSNYMNCSPVHAIVTTDTCLMFPLQITNKEIKLRGRPPKWKELIKFITLSCSFRTALGPPWRETRVRMLEWSVNFLIPVWVHRNRQRREGYLSLQERLRGPRVGFHHRPAIHTIPQPSCPSSRSPGWKNSDLQRGERRTVGWGGDLHLGCTGESPGEIVTVPSLPPPPPPGWTLEQLYLNPCRRTPESSSL